MLLIVIRVDGYPVLKSHSVFIPFVVGGNCRDHSNRGFFIFRRLTLSLPVSEKIDRDGEKQTHKKLVQYFRDSWSQVSRHITLIVVVDEVS